MGKRSSGVGGGHGLTGALLAYKLWRKANGESSQGEGLMVKSSHDHETGKLNNGSGDRSRSKSRKKEHSVP